VVQLERNRDYVVGSVNRAAYYRRVQDRQKEVQAWEDIFRHGRNAARHWAIAELFLEGQENMIKSLDTVDPETRIAQAYVLALSPVPSDRKKAFDIFHELTAVKSSWFMRHMLIQIPLLLHDTQTAKDQCATWVRSSDSEAGFDSEFRWERESIEFLAGESPWNRDSSDPIERFYANYQEALLAFGDRDISNALQRLSQCGPVFHVGPLKSWVKVFKKEFQKSAEIEDNESDTTPVR
jgi:hypothetical protein